MRKLEQLKLNELSKADLKEREMAKLYGGTYCGNTGYPGDNFKFNEAKGTCSCACIYGLDYYTIRKEDESYMKVL